jgi:hypothetical protein
MAQVRFYRGTQETFDSLEEVDPDGLYIIGGENGSGESEPQDD